MSKAAKNRGKTHSKNGKTGKCAEGQDDESTYSFQNYDSRRLLMFLYQVLAYRKGNLVFNIVCGNLWFDGDFFVRNLDTSVGLHQYKSLSQRFFFLFFLLWTFFRFWFFHEQRFFLEQRDSTSEFSKVPDVNKIWINMKIEPKHKRLLRKFPQEIRPGPR